MEDRIKELEARVSRLEAQPTARAIEMVPIEIEMVPIDELYYGVNRPQKWIDKHPEFTRSIENIKKSIKEVGMLKPLEIDMGNVVQKGNQRLFALREMGWNKLVKCVRT
jgi:ParB-like chromosome segregation protein Spo0J